MSNEINRLTYRASDRAAKAMLTLALGYLLLGLCLGTIGGFQYILPDFLKKELAFQKTRPLHVYLVIAWIFASAQAAIYYYLPRVAGRPVFWVKGMWLHVFLQGVTSLIIVTCFFMGRFGGREYLEFPPWLGGFILLSWIPFAVNFWFTIKPNYKTAPVYIWMWSTGILFFFITMSESYLWIFDFFKTNIVRDVTVQWKALGSMVGSWNMLVYGTGIYVMEKISGDTKTAKSTTAFFFYFLGFTNLMFNWGHHTYIVPAAPWVKMTAYIISMTELLILVRIIYLFKRTVSEAQRNFHSIPWRLLSFADFWILLNLAFAIFLSVPAWNLYTHGTHFTVAHAMGATIGINTMLLLTSVFYIIQEEQPGWFSRNKALIRSGIWISNISLLAFWISLIGSGMVRVSSKMNNELFAEMMEKSLPWFKLFAWSGTVIVVGLFLLIIPAMKALVKRKPVTV